MRFIALTLIWIAFIVNSRLSILDIVGQWVSLFAKWTSRTVVKQGRITEGFKGRYRLRRFHLP